jgi:gentisate 1,2-dioxygenase
MESYIKAYEYESNVNPSLKNIPITTKNIIDCDYGITFINLPDVYNVKHKITTPNLLASFIKLEKNNNIELKDKNVNNFINGSSHLFYIMKGKCKILLDNEIYILSNDEIFISPFFDLIQIENTSDEDLHIYYVNDSPLINYLGSTPVTPNFKASIYSNEFIHNKLHELSNPNNNRKGILLSNIDTEIIGINTITPILWSLYNELPPLTQQKAHKHNSVALDLCINCTDSENVYTLVGEKIDEEGNIIDPIKVNWKKGEMFITPPGLWHSHNNIGNTFAYILPIQDAGLLLFQRILGIELYKK